LLVFPGCQLTYRCCIRILLSKRNRNVNSCYVVRRYELIRTFPFGVSVSLMRPMLTCMPPIVASAATRPAFTERSYLTFRVFRPTSTFQWHIAEPRLSWHILAGVSALTHLHPFTRGMAACSKFCKAIIGQRTSTFARSIIYSR